ARPVLVFFSETVTPGSTAFDGSSTVPDRSKVLTCPRAGAARAMVITTAHMRQPGFTNDVISTSGASRGSDFPWGPTSRLSFASARRAVALSAEAAAGLQESA